MQIILNFVMYVICLLIGLRIGSKRGFVTTMTKLWFLDQDAHSRILTEIHDVLVKRGVNVDEKAFNDIVKYTNTEQGTDRKDDFSQEDISQEDIDSVNNAMKSFVMEEERNQQKNADRKGDD